MRTAAPVGGLVLAAGLGRRFGGAKLAAQLEGRPLLAHLLDTVRSALDGGTLVTTVVVIPAGRDAPAEASLLRRLAEERGMTVVVNDDPAAGLSDEELSRLRGPIGLDLGGRQASEIALAILAEMTAVRYGASVGR